MPITHRILEQEKLVISHWTGILDDAEILAAYRSLYEDKRWKPGFNEIADLREANIEAITGHGLFRLSKLVDDFVGSVCSEFKTAVIFPKKYHSKPFILYDAFTEKTSEDVRVFTDLESAYKWLGVDVSILG